MGGVGWQGGVDGGAMVASRGKGSGGVSEDVADAGAESLRCLRGRREATSEDVVGVTGRGRRAAKWAPHSTPAKDDREREGGEASGVAGQRGGFDDGVNLALGGGEEALNPRTYRQ